MEIRAHRISKYDGILNYLALNRNYTQWKFSLQCPREEVLAASECHFLLAAACTELGSFVGHNCVLRSVGFIFVCFIFHWFYFLWVLLFAGSIFRVFYFSLVLFFAGFIFHVLFSLVLFSEGFIFHGFYFLEVLFFMCFIFVFQVLCVLFFLWYYFS